MRKAKLTEIEAVDREKTLLEYIRCELNESKTLEEAKDRVDGTLMLMTMLKKVLEGDADAFVDSIRNLAKTNQLKAAYLAVHGVDMTERAELD